MIPEQMSREALVKFVKHHCTLCKKACPPFRKGEHYEVYQDDEYVNVITDKDESISFTYPEASEHFTASSRQEK